MYQVAYSEIVDEAPRVLREREHEALERVIDMLKRAKERGARSTEAVEALHYLRALWRIFLEDLRSPGNALPAELRNALISLGLWVNREIDRLSDGASADFGPLIEINEIICKGLT